MGVGAAAPERTFIVCDKRSRLRDRRFDWAYLFGAVCSASGATAAYVTPKANAWAFQLHLDEISRNITHGAHAVLILDGAGWHRAAKLAIPANVTLLILPPYSPELNPIENVWQYLRQNFLSNRVFENHDAILQACCDAWNAFVAQPDASDPSQRATGRQSKFRRAGIRVQRLHDQLMGSPVVSGGDHPGFRELGRLPHPDSLDDYPAPWLASQ